MIGAGNNLIHMCIYVAWKCSFFQHFLKICSVYFTGKLCNVPCGGVLLCVKDSNMTILRARDTVIVIYIGGGPYRNKGTYCDPNLTGVQF